MSCAGGSGAGRLALASPSSSASSRDGREASLSGGLVPSGDECTVRRVSHEKRPSSNRLNDTVE